MDYIFCFALQTYRALPTYFVSYDIACQWSKKLWERMSKMPSNLQFEHEGKSLTLAYPSSTSRHIKNPAKLCIPSTSSHLSDGQTVKHPNEDGPISIPSHQARRKWGRPGSRRDTLDDFFEGRGNAYATWLCACVLGTYGSDAFQVVHCCSS